MAGWQRERNIAKQEGRKLDIQIDRGARNRRQKDRVADWQREKHR